MTLTFPRLVLGSVMQNPALVPGCHWIHQVSPQPLHDRDKLGKRNACLLGISIQDYQRQEHYPWFVLARAIKFLEEGFLGKTHNAKSKFWKCHAKCSGHISDAVTQVLLEGTTHSPFK